jgi:hypothetical protein
VRVRVWVGVGVAVKFALAEVGEVDWRDFGALERHLLYQKG